MGILIFIVLLVFVIGTVVGSFLNVVILRGLTGESIVLPPSKCPKCNNKLKPWHNIPILSYLCLGGKCAFCKEKISPQYPIVELFTGLMFVALLFKFGPTLTAITAIITSCAMTVLAVTDIKEKVICTGHAYFLIIMGLFFSTYFSVISVSNAIYETGAFLPAFDNIINLTIVNSILGIIAGIAVMEILARLGYLLVGTRAFGDGDSYIAAGLGAVFGWKNVLIIIALSIALQLILVLPMFMKRLVCKKDWTTLTPLLLFFVYAAGFGWLEYSDNLKSFTLTMLLAVGFLIVGLYTCRKILKGLEKPEDMTMLPFGPAMVIAAYIIMFVTPAGI